VAEGAPTTFTATMVDAHTTEGAARPHCVDLLGEHRHVDTFAWAMFERPVQHLPLGAPPRPSTRDDFADTMHCTAIAYHLDSNLLTVGFALGGCVILSLADLQLLFFIAPDQDAGPVTHLAYQVRRS